MITGHIEAADGHLDKAIAAFEQVAEQDVDYVPEILPPLLDSYARSQQMDRAEEFLLDIIETLSGRLARAGACASVHAHARRGRGRRIPQPRSCASVRRCAH